MVEYKHDILFSMFHRSRMINPRILRVFQKLTDSRANVFRWPTVTRTRAFQQPGNTVKWRATPNTQHDRCYRIFPFLAAINRMTQETTLPLIRDGLHSSSFRWSTAFTVLLRAM